MTEEKKKKEEINDLRNKIKELEEELDFCKKEKEEYLNGWKREKADFINYKKEELEKISRAVEYNKENLIMKILPILDSFNHASEKIPEDLKEEDDFIKGLLQIKVFFENFLKNEGVEELKCLGKEFDPFFHEAVEMVDDENNESGIIVGEIERGYKFKEKLLRPAKVKVTK